jgi:hypothetical protein
LVRFDLLLPVLHGSGGAKASLIRRQSFLQPKRVGDGGCPV